MATIPTTMRAIVIDSFGGVERLRLQTLAVPKADAGEVLIRISYAGVAVWDPIEREGIFAKMMNMQPAFPLILGSEGAGEVVAVGPGVGSPRVGDQVYAVGFLNPKGGFYAEYAAVKADLTHPIPPSMNAEQASTYAVDAGTALRGLDDVLHLKSGESILIFGAGGGLGHLAVQLAKRMGAKVLAIASGSDGVDLCKRIGADLAIDGRADDVVSAARKFASSGLDAALLAAGGPAADKALTTLKSTGRAAYPNGVQPVPKPPAGITATAFDCDPKPQLFARLHRLVGNASFTVHVAKTFQLQQAADAHRMLDTHYLGKLALKVS
jgi:NADPH:quinone reductase-like Zn-dependent oxidoreductase